LTLTINGDKVDFRLEEERILREALGGIEDWLSESGMVVTAVRCDGKALSAEALRAAWDTPLERVSELAIEARHAREIRMAALREDLADLVERERTAPDAERAEASRRREDASRRIRETVETYGALQSLTGEIASMEARIGEVSILLQSGKDRQAMETITRFADLIEAVLAVLPRTVGGGEAAALFAEINPRLREILEAFGAGDFILIGDILEYEIAPRLGGLAALLSRCA
jgi:hypothetical protein